MKTERRDLPAEGHDPLAHKGGGTCSFQRGGKCREIRVEFLGRNISSGRIRVLDGQQHLGPHQERRGAPRFLPVALDDVIDVDTGLSPQVRVEAPDHRREFFRNRLEDRSERDIVAERLQGAALHAQGIDAKRPQRGLRHLGRHERVAVTVAADPGAETDEGRQIIERPRIEAGRFPGFAQMGVRPGQSLGKHLAQVMQRVVEFRLDAGSRHVNLTGAPEAFELDLNLAREPGLLARRAVRVLVSVQQCCRSPDGVPGRSGAWPRSGAL